MKTLYVISSLFLSGLLGYFAYMLFPVTGWGWFLFSSFIIAFAPLANIME